MVASSAVQPLQFDESGVQQYAQPEFMLYQDKQRFSGLGEQQLLLACGREIS